MAHHAHHYYSHSPQEDHNTTNTTPSDTTTNAITPTIAAMPNLLNYWNVDDLPNITDKSYVSNWNLLFLKCLNYGLTYALLWAVAPDQATYPVAYWVHLVGSLCFVVVSVVNTAALCVLWPKRPSRHFQPVPILLATLSTPLIILATCCV